LFDHKDLSTEMKRKILRRWRRRSQRTVSSEIRPWLWAVKLWKGDQ